MNKIRIKETTMVHPDLLMPQNGIDVIRMLFHEFCGAVIHKGNGISHDESGREITEEVTASCFRNTKNEVIGCVTLSTEQYPSSSIKRQTITMHKITRGPSSEIKNLALEIIGQESLDQGYNGIIVNIQGGSLLLDTSYGDTVIRFLARANELAKLAKSNRETELARYM